MKDDGIGWRFPPTNGGRVDGFNDPGIAHFDGNPLVSLARETIQNSLDAKAGPGPVEMEFAIEEIALQEALGRSELAEAIGACLKAVGQEDDKARAMLNHASALLQRDRLPYLRVADHNTTGLRLGHWRALVKWQGASVKEQRTAGGSHGIGKYAPFAVSPLRTVYYWTRFEEEGELCELFQGKAVLLSHMEPGPKNVETQGTGFYGARDGCRELHGSNIPPRIRRAENGPNRGNGTSLWIAGFSTADNWQAGIARSVIASFFYAIERDMLSVVIEPDRLMVERNLLQIDRSTILDWFEYLAPDSSAVQRSTGEDDAIAEAYQFWEIVRTSDPTAEKQDGDLGHCRLWVRVGDGLPSKVGFVRRTGMLITTQQEGLRRFGGLNEFIALCVLDSDEGNALLRNMENPRHDQFEPERLPESEQRRGRAALKRLTSWIREEIKKCAAPPTDGEATDLDELAQYLPDLQPDDEFDAPARNGEGERSFSGRQVVRLKPRVSVAPPSLVDEDDGDDEGDGHDTGDQGGGGDGRNDGGGGTGIGGDTGAGERGDGSRGGGSGRETVPIHDVRLLPAQDERRCRVSFVAGSGGHVQLEVGEAGDSTVIARPDVEILDSDGAALSADGLNLTEGKRTTIEITAKQPLGGRAWRIRAIRKGGR